MHTVLKDHRQFVEVLIDAPEPAVKESVEIKFHAVAEHFQAIRMEIILERDCHPVFLLGLPVAVPLVVMEIGGELTCGVVPVFKDIDFRWPLFVTCKPEGRPFTVAVRHFGTAFHHEVRGEVISPADPGIQVQQADGIIDPDRVVVFFPVEILWLVACPEPHGAVGEREIIRGVVAG